MNTLTNPLEIFETAERTIIDSDISFQLKQDDSFRISIDEQSNTDISFSAEGYLVVEKFAGCYDQPSSSTCKAVITGSLYYENGEQKEAPESLLNRAIEEIEKRL